MIHLFTCSVKLRLYVEQWAETSMSVRSISPCSAAIVWQLLFSASWSPWKSQDCSKIVFIHALKKDLESFPPFSYVPNSFYKVGVICSLRAWYHLLLKHLCLFKFKRYIFYYCFNASYSFCVYLGFIFWDNFVNL